MADETSEAKTVAVIGSGLAGLTTAYLLSLSGLVVTLYEREDVLGMDSQSIFVPCNSSPGAKSIRVETPMRSFSGGFYHELLKLYRHLEVPIERKPFTYNFFDGQTGSTYTTYNGQGGLSGFASNLGWLDTILVVIGFLQYLALALFFTYTGLTKSAFLCSLSHHQFCQMCLIPQVFRDKYLDPIFMAVTTCTQKDLDCYPASYILEYRAKTFLRPHYTTQVAEVVQKLAQPVSRVLLGHAVEARADGPIVMYKGEQHKYDFLVFAYPDQQVPRTKTSVITHKNAGACMPKQSARDLNLGVYKNFTTASQLISSSGETVIQTTLPTEQVHLITEYVVARSDFSRARAIAGRETASNRDIRPDGSRLANENGRNGIYHVGSYVSFGIPLLEGCVSSARLVVEDLLRREKMSNQMVRDIFGRNCNGHS